MILGTSADAGGKPLNASGVRCLFPGSSPPICGCEPETCPKLKPFKLYYQRISAKDTKHQYPTVEIQGAIVLDTLYACAVLSSTA